MNQARATSTGSRWIGALSFGLAFAFAWIAYAVEHPLACTIDEHCSDGLRSAALPGWIAMASFLGAHVRFALACAVGLALLLCRRFGGRERDLALQWAGIATAAYSLLLCVALVASFVVVRFDTNCMCGN